MWRYGCDTVEEHDEFAVARLVGEVDLSNAVKLLERLLAAISNRSHSVILDLSATDYLDSAGLRLVFEARRALHARRQRLRVVAPPDGFAAEVLRTAGLGETVPVDGALSDALDAVSSRRPTTG
jgi:anti-anti-sigma factor